MSKNQFLMTPKQSSFHLIIIVNNVCLLSKWLLRTSRREQLFPLFALAYSTGMTWVIIIQLIGLMLGKNIHNILEYSFYRHSGTPVIYVETKFNKHNVILFVLIWHIVFSQFVTAMMEITCVFLINIFTAIILISFLPW